MAEQTGDKRHDATPHRRQKAREEGQSPKSQDLTSAMLLLGALLVLLIFGGSVGDFFRELAQQQLGGQAWLTADKEFVVSTWHGVVWQVGWVVLPIFGVVLLIAVAANLGQVGILFLPKKVAPNPEHVSPLKGVQRVFSVAGMMRLGFGLLKVAIVVGVAGLSLYSEQERIIALSAMTAGQVFVFLFETTVYTCIKIAVALLILAILDYAYQRIRFENQIKMTDQEVREEMKNLQGDPQMAARRKAVQRQLVMNRLGSIVPEADVVVTNPTELAIAIKFDIETMPAPIVIAKGAGVLADRIRKLALENEVPIIERKPLARFLYKHVDVNQPVPMEQYAAVAEVLRYVYRLKGKPLPTLPDTARRKAA